MTRTRLWLISGSQGGKPSPTGLFLCHVDTTQRPVTNLHHTWPPPSLGQTLGSSHDRKWGANNHKGLWFLASQLAERLRLKRGHSCLLTGWVASYDKIPSVLDDGYKRQMQPSASMFITNPNAACAEIKWTSARLSIQFTTTATCLYMNGIATATSCLLMAE